MNPYLSSLFLLFPLVLNAQEDDALERYLSTEIRKIKLENLRLKQENLELKTKLDNVKEELNGCENKNTKTSEYLNLGFATLGAITGSICAYKGSN